MQLGFTLHDIITGPTAADSIAPGLVHEFDDKDFLDLLRLDAIRMPTDVEVQLYEMANGEPAGAPAAAADPEPDTKAERAALEAEAKTLEISVHHKHSNETIAAKITEAKLPKDADVLPAPVGTSNLNL